MEFLHWQNLTIVSEAKIVGHLGNMLGLPAHFEVNSGPQSDQDLILLDLPTTYDQIVFVHDVSELFLDTSFDETDSNHSIKVTQPINQSREKQMCNSKTKIDELIWEVVSSRYSPTRVIQLL